MMRIFLPLLCSMLGLAAASCSQSDGPFGPADSAASARALSQGAAAASMASPPDPSQTDAPPAEGSPSGSQPEAPTGTASGAAAARRASMVIGMPVVSAEGSPLGEVKDIIFDSLGRATHVVIAYAAQTQAGASSPDGRLVAVPWDTAAARITDGHLVLDASNLQGAPSFKPEEWPDLDNPTWSATADAYWRKVALPPLAAHRSLPIDSMARRRARPTRDGD